MKKIVGSVLLLAIVVTVVFPVIAFASSSAPMTANEMNVAIGGQQLGLCESAGGAARALCSEFGGGWFTCWAIEMIVFIACSAV